MYALQNYLFEEVSPNPLIRLGIKNPSVHRVRICSFIFSAYHAVKAKVRSGQIVYNPDALTQSSIRQAWGVFALTAAAEAGEQRVNTRSFSLPSFLEFLCNGCHNGSLNSPLQVTNH